MTVVVAGHEGRGEGLRRTRGGPLAEGGCRVWEAGRKLDAERFYVAPTTYALREPADKALHDDPRRRPGGRARPADSRS